MNNSSAQDTSSITLDSLDTITLTSATGSPTWDTCGTYTISTASIPTSYSFTSGMTVGGISTIDTSHTFTLPEEWVNCLPDLYRIQKMCKEYPGLAVAFEKFKTVYNLVKDDYDTPKDQRPRP